MPTTTHHRIDIYLGVYQGIIRLALESGDEKLRDLFLQVLRPEPGALHKDGDTVSTRRIKTESNR